MGKFEMKQEDIFSADVDSIGLNGLESIINFTRYKAKKSHKYINGLELADDLITSTGIIFYTKGTELTRNRISKLLELHDLNPELTCSCKIKRSAMLMQIIRKEINDQFQKTFQRWKGVKIYSDMLERISKDVEKSVELILSDEDRVLALYKVKFICESAKSNRADAFFDHAINVAIFASAVVSTYRYSSIIEMNEAKLMDILDASLFLNYGALLQIDEILIAPVDESLNMYWEANRRGSYYLTNIRFNFDITDAQRYLYDYYSGRNDFIAREEWPATMANIILVVDVFLQKTAGLFNDLQSIRAVVDNLNVRAFENEISVVAVQALTMELNLQDIFDFYRELEILSLQCTKQAAIPYPLKCFLSPVIFVCSNNIVDCEYISGYMKAVKLFKTLGELQPGEYRRCKLLTPKLWDFYNEHYSEIKEDVQGNYSVIKKKKILPPKVDKVNELDTEIKHSENEFHTSRRRERR
jgi:hypothetical protein